ncbi:MAG: hypothetical protein JWL61_2312 [Gemmatimonadetes bacterium]|nr:hypothetical protein [Gemmatimonadota bacterium]
MIGVPMPIAIAEQCVQQIPDAAQRVCIAERDELEAIAARDEHLAELTNRFFGQPNALTGKEHSITSAERAAVQLDSYKELQRARVDAECSRIVAWADYERAKLTARLAVAAVEHS